MIRQMDITEATRDVCFLSLIAVVAISFAIFTDRTHRLRADVDRLAKIVGELQPVAKASRVDPEADTQVILRHSSFDRRPSSAVGSD